MNEKRLQTTWASHSIIERALAYYRVRMAGSSIIFIALLFIQWQAPSDGPIKALIVTSLDIALLLWQRTMVYRGKPKLATWVSLIAASIIGTIGLHLGGGFITLSFGVYLVLILSAALVFRTRRATYSMAAISGFFYLLLAITELSSVFNTGNPANPVFRDVYDFSEQSRLLMANFCIPAPFPGFLRRWPASWWRRMLASY